MPVPKDIDGINLLSLATVLIIALMVCSISSCNNNKSQKQNSISSLTPDSVNGGETPDRYPPVYNLLILPKDPEPGEPFRILATGMEDTRKAKIIVTGPSGVVESVKSKSGDQLPYWQIDEFTGSPPGNYKVIMTTGKRELRSLEFTISPMKVTQPQSIIWKTLRGWDGGMEAIYSAWINALFYGCDENKSWTALHDVIQNKDQNFLYNYLSLGEDDPKRKTRLIMQPDCADNPFYLRAYFAWKLGLPFGYHICDRGSLSHNPRTGLWITNESPGTKTDPVLSFNLFLRRVMNDVHSGTARTGLDDDNSDYYPVPLERRALLPGTVFADPYGHTLILIGWVPQTRVRSGLLLAVDAQPDGTIGIKRFWKGNFLFTTSGVIGEPGFKAFRPIKVHEKALSPVQNKLLTVSAGFVPFSLQQRKMKSDVFYHTMERLINPKPLDPESALLGLIDALHEQLQVRVTSVSNGEAYMQSHPGTVIPMPSSAAGIFQAGGQWENFSTPNRDLRLLIAMDAVIDFPDLASHSPADFNISKLGSPDEARLKLQAILDKKVTEISISYFRTNGSLQELTVGEILARRDAFEMAYNPNDGIEIRWGAPEDSEERSACLRHAPAYQLEIMRSVRSWFHKRLHPPT
jgi:hypothetical protein